MRKPIVRLSRTAKGAGVALAATGLLAGSLSYVALQGSSATAADAPAPSATPIKHLVVLFDENVSFDHYFGTYPQAANLPNDGAKFTGTAPKVNNYLSDPAALNNNPNTVAPFRLSSREAVTCDQSHSYLPEQKAVDGGKMDQFVQSVSTNSACNSPTVYGVNGETMGYYDGNTVTGLWNYAQHYAMSDNSWDATFGPSTPGALNLVSGQTHGVVSYAAAGLGADNKTADPSNTSATPVQLATPDSYTDVDPNADGVGTVINDPDPVYDDCNNSNHKSANAVGGMTGQNIGDLLNAKNVTWGWFQGGFAPTTPYDASTGAAAVCGASHPNINGTSALDYSPHHNPFEYYKSTSNPHHLAPTPGIAIGAADPNGANHQYDESVFDTAAQTGTLPAVSFVKAAEYQDGHASYSDPTDEQNFLTKTINELEQGPEWSSTAVIIAYDDSDGWYDHVAPKITNGSASPTNDTTVCSSAPTASAPLGGYQDRCGPSQRLPFLLISPYAKVNYVSHTLTSQPSITKFIEDNWLSGTRIGDGSFDATAGSINDMFNTKATSGTVILNSNGTVKSDTQPKPPVKKPTKPVKKHHKPVKHHKPAKHHPAKHKPAKKHHKAVTKKKAATKKKH